MRLAVRVLATVALLLVAAGVALAIFLPRLAQRPEVRARIEAAARDASGRELRYESLSAGILPPEIEVLKPTLAADRAGEPPLFTADRVALRLALLPLLGRSIVIDRLRVDGARVHLVRTSEPKHAAAAPAGAEGAAPGPAPPRMPLGVRTLDVEDARVTLEDRTLSPPVTLVLEDIRARARATSPDAPIALDATLHLAGGGDVAVEGTATLAGEIDAVATLTKVEASPFAAYLGERRKLAGKIGGTLHAIGPATAPERIDAKLVFGEAAIEIDDVRLRGKLALSATLSNRAGVLGGPFEIDATEAELAYGGSFRKPPGTPATTSGTLQASPGGGFDVDELHVKIKNFEAHGSLRSGPPASLALDAPPFELAGWEPLLPALAGVALGGRLALEDLRASTRPVALGGAIVLGDVRLAAPGRPPVVFRGRLEGAGNALRSRDLAAEVAGQPVALDLAVAPLARAPVGTLVATARGVDAEALIAAFSKSDASVTGPLRFDARFEAPLASGKPILSVLVGTLDFSLGPGHVKGVSLLRQTLERSGPVVQSAVAAGQAFGGRDVKRMSDDRFESIGGLVKLAGGMARFDPIRAVYRDYRLDVRGSVRLADRALDATGQVVFADVKGAGAMRGQTLPISRIAGTVEQPRVELSPEDIAVIVAQVSGSVLERKLDPFVEKLRKEAGGARSPLDALQSLLGGKKRN